MQFKYCVNKDYVICKYSGTVLPHIGKKACHKPKTAEGSSRVLLYTVGPRMESPKLLPGCDKLAEI